MTGFLEADIDAEGLWHDPRCSTIVGPLLHEMGNERGRTTQPSVSLSARSKSWGRLNIFDPIASIPPTKHV
jgi:hypothetical protein